MYCIRARKSILLTGQPETWQPYWWKSPDRSCQRMP